MGSGRGGGDRNPRASAAMGSGPGGQEPQDLGKKWARLNAGYG